MKCAFFVVLFKGVSTRFGLRTIEKSIENAHFIFCHIANLLQKDSIIRTNASFGMASYGFVQKIVAA
jgi:hypothetical protein